MSDMNKPEVIHLNSCASTNSYAAGLPVPERGSGLCFIVTDEQTAGRGQKGNHWEAEPGKNLTFSVLWKPEGVAAAGQFALSEAVALAVVDLLGENGIEAKVKWPNDIYVGDRKICGILIEHSLFGYEISRTIAGVGINVNQYEFLSDAPNPVSMVQLTGASYSLHDLLMDYADCLEKRLKKTETTEGREMLHEEYKNRMWRGDDDFYPFRDVATGKRYLGRIMDVELTGFLHILPLKGEKEQRYAFKEVEFLPSEGF